jgi:hypothetical protein
MRELTHEQKKILHAYLMTFTSDFGKIVLDDLKKSFFDKVVPDHDLENHSLLVKRVTEQGVYLKIIRMMERAAEEIERANGVTPAVMPLVERDMPEED